MNLHEMDDDQLAERLHKLTSTLKGDMFKLTADERMKAQNQVETLKQLLLTDMEDKSARILLDWDSPECQEIVEILSKYADENPYVTYRSQGEDLDNDPELLQKLFDCETPEEVSDWYMGLYERIEESFLFGDYDYEGPYWEEAWAEVVAGEVEGIPAGDKLDGVSMQTLKELLRDREVYVQIDCTEHIRGILYSTNVKIRAIPMTAAGHKVYSPHFEACSDENLEDGKYLNRVFKMKTDQTKPENWSDATYSGSHMVFMGDIDLCEIVESRKLPNSIEISPGDSYVFFNGGNGSGSGFEPVIGRPVRLRCRFVVDNAKDNRYGVDETYGFSHSVWRGCLAASYHEWPQDVEAYYQSKTGWRSLKVSK